MVPVRSQVTRWHTVQSRGTWGWSPCRAAVYSCAQCVLHNAGDATHSDTLGNHTRSAEAKKSSQSVTVTRSGLQDVSWSNHAHKKSRAFINTSVNWILSHLISTNSPSSPLLRNPEFYFLLWIFPFGKTHFCPGPTSLLTLPFLFAPSNVTL